MTTLAILSDIHGNLPALEAVMADMALFPIDQVIVAGGVCQSQCVGLYSKTISHKPRGT
jgi:predicted phosphodiesterase